MTDLEKRLLDLVDRAFPWIEIWGYPEAKQEQDKLTNEMYEVLKEHGKVE